MKISIFKVSIEKQTYRSKVALNIMISCFLLKEKLFCWDDLPLLSAADIREWTRFRLFQTKTDEVLIAVRNKGIFKLENREPKPVLVDPFFSGKIIRFILPYKEDQLMIGTASNGIVTWDGGGIKTMASRMERLFCRKRTEQGTYFKKW